MKKKIFLRTNDLRERERVQAPLKPPGEKIFTQDMNDDGKLLGMTDQSYVLRYASPDDFKKMREELEERRAKLPARTYWICERCGRGVLRDADEVRSPCIFCNWQGFEDGGFLRLMTEEEKEKFKADDDTAWEARSEAHKKAQRLRDEEFKKRALFGGF